MTLISVRRYRCPVCGGDIALDSFSESSGETGETLTFTEELRHHGPVDAACRLVFEALADERKSIIDASVLAAMKQMGGDQ